MKKKILVLALTCIGYSAFSQVTKDSLLKKMALEICDEIDEDKLKGKDKEELSMELGMLMLPVFTKYETELKAAYHIEDVSDAEGMEKIGRDLGMKIPLLCPKFIKLITQNNALREEIIESKTVSSSGQVVQAPVQTLAGKVLTVEGTEFLWFNFKTKLGKIEKIYWFGYFEGEELLRNIKDAAGKDAAVEYSEQEVYNGKLKDYIRIKIVRKLVLLK